MGLPIGLHIQNYTQDEWSQTPYLASTGHTSTPLLIPNTGRNLHKQNHTQEEWSQTPYLTSTGLTSSGLTSTGLTSTPLLVPNPDRKCRFYWPAQAKPHIMGVIPLPVRTSRRRHR